ncbi:MAG: hypothetical protein VSS75_030960, partial [Candidatus Parabeggiatoa sp.]|nr:hypothetical protein [Candidatus Parabeggiatoa sp.]
RYQLKKSLFTPILALINIKIYRTFNTKKTILFILIYLVLFKSRLWGEQRGRDVRWISLLERNLPLE